MKAVSLASTSKKDIELVLNRLVNEFNLSSLGVSSTPIDPRVYESEKGAKGDTGEAGPTGPKGRDSGDAGTNGSNGQQGTQGIQGVQGLTGGDGANGSDGAQGESGLGFGEFSVNANGNLIITHTGSYVDNDFEITSSGHLTVDA